MKDLYKELNERLEYLNLQQKTTENDTRIDELNHIIVRVQQILLKKLDRISMPQEIERKFLVIGDYKSFAISENNIIQGYISSKPSVRIRIKNDKGYLTIKGKKNKTGVSRYEFEKEIELAEANELMLLCQEGKIKKTRYNIPVGEHIFEVDEFHDENDGLVIAEVELSDENEEFIKPEWLGEEVTGRKEYYNSYISKNSYRK